MPEVPSEPNSDSEELDPDSPARELGEQVRAPEGPQGPFDRLFEDLGEAPAPTHSTTPNGWHAAWERQSQQGAGNQGAGGAIQRPDDAPFATVTPPSPIETRFPYGYGYQPATAPTEHRRPSIIRPAGRLVRELAETIVLALAIFLLVRAVVQNFQVEGRSMEPTFESGWYLLVNKSLYWEVNLETVGKFVPFVDAGNDPTRYIFRAPKRGDVIVFRQPNQPIGAEERDFIKRVIGLPGEVVEVHDGTVFVNGEPLRESYISEKPAYDCPPKLVPQGTYFVLGDNRNNSSDSHSWGPVPKENIIGQAWLVYWPFEDFGLVDNDHVKPDEEQAEPVAPNKDETPLLTVGGCTAG